MLSALALATVLYSVKPGDTLSGIAQHYNTTWEAIYNDNHAAIENPNMVYAGQQLRVPEGDKTATLVPAQTSAAAAVQQPAASASTAKAAPVQSYKVSAAPAAATVKSTQTSTASSNESSGSSASAGSSSGSLSDIPGVPASFAACVAYRESTNDTNPAANGNAYGIIDASGYHVSGDSLAQQKQVFKEIYDTTGPSAWAADGCNK
jgi:LysM repeat protein